MKSTSLKKFKTHIYIYIYIYIYKQQKKKGFTKSNMKLKCVLLYKIKINNKLSLTY